MGREDVVQSVLDAAKYLRRVRPIDPEELGEYVTGTIDTADIRTLLREHAVSLGLYEREDGAFVPVPEDRRTPEFRGVPALPDDIAAAVTEVLVADVGGDWYAGRSGDRLRRSIRTFKEAYFAGEPVTYDRSTALGYAIYHLPGTFAKIQYTLDTLGRNTMLPRTIRVLDVGAGVGGVPLGIARYLGPEWPVAYRGIEPSDAARDVCRRLLPNTHRNFQWVLDDDRVETATLAGRYDLIVLANVLNELANPVAVLDRLVDVLADDGSIVVIAPADERTSRGLRRVEHSICDDRTAVDVYEPTLRLWPDRAPTDACWSFRVCDPIEVPTFQRDLDEGPRNRSAGRDPATGEFRHEDIRFSDSILRTDGSRITPFRPDRSHFVPLSEVEGNVGQRVRISVVKLSHSLANDDAHPLFVIGDGSQDEEHFAVHAHETSLNRVLADAAYGAVLGIDGGLVLWNEDEHAYNIVIDGETVVDPITRGSEPGAY